MTSLAKREWPDVARWSACFVVALLVHGAGAAAILTHWDSPDAGVDVPVVMLDLGPLEAAPDVAPSNAALPEEKKEEPEPEPEKPAAEVKPEEPAPPLPPAAAVELPTPPPPEKSKQERHVKLMPLSAPASAERQGAQATSPLHGAQGRDSRTEQLWNQALIARIKSHVGQAPSHQTGTVLISFSVNRAGGLVSARLEQSSGSDALDRAGLDIVRRAAPFPPPPPDLHGTAIQRTVPIRFR